MCPHLTMATMSDQPKLLKDKLVTYDLDNISAAKLDMISALKELCRFPFEETERALITSTLAQLICCLILPSMVITSTLVTLDLHYEGDTNLPNTDPTSLEPDLYILLY